MTVEAIRLMRVMPNQAGIYKCTQNGHTGFSDQPCADKAQSISIHIHNQVLTLSLLLAYTCSPS